MSYKATDVCRVCHAASLRSMLHLGEQALTGVFPKPGEVVESGPLELVWCASCTLLQLHHSYDAEEMYGDNYGYRSGLNASMVAHLAGKSARLAKLTNLSTGDVVLDIGCNDGTLLNSYTVDGIRRLGIDPTVDKFRSYHSSEIVAMAAFFSAETFAQLSTKKAKIITSIAMFYDLEDPIAFARQVADCLDDDGVWHFEQSYMPSMLRSNAYDTVCHEHIEYYSLEVVMRILDAADMEVTAVRFNSVNGGSFAVTAMKKGHSSGAEAPLVGWLLEQEKRMDLSTPTPFRHFEDRVYRHRDDLGALIKTLRSSGNEIMGYGASTKGNVMLQFCGIDNELVPAIAEVNPDKFGRETPGTKIPIISEDEMRARDPDYLLVLPWHFREGIVKRETEYLRKGGRLIFPLPEIEIVGD